MSGDEIFVLLASCIAAAVAWGGWYVRSIGVERLGAPTRGRAPLWLAPPLAGVLLFVVLRTLAAHDVRDDARYLLMYEAMGAAWVGVAARAAAIMGMSARDDVYERGNRAAGFALAGVVLAITLCFAGGNIGDGPGWWVVVYSAALSTVALLVLWAMLDAVSSVNDVVTIDRDAAAGLRLAGFLVGVGCILGRAVAGDWVSARATVGDFLAFSWRVLPLVALAALVDARARPTPARPAAPVLLAGALPGLLYAGIGAALVYLAGIPT